VKDYTFEVCKLTEIKQYVECNHYSKSVNGLKVSFCFRIINSTGHVVGAAIYGQQSTTAWKKYVEKECDLLELRRLCTTDKMRNLLSCFVGWCNNYIKKNSDIKLLLSYADPYNGHIGYIYQATNWLYVGETQKDIVLKTPEGKIYHSRAMRTKYNGVLKPFAARLKEMDENGVLERINIPGKHTYLFVLKGKFNFISKPYPKITKEIK
jgi:Fe-S cluster biosynthesis and repair protein YggX